MRTNQAADNTNVSSKQRGQWRDVWRRFKQNKSAILGMILFILILFFVFGASLFYDYEEAIKINIKAKNLPPFSEGYVFGTDSLGRNLGARLLHGGKNSLSIGFSSVLFSLILGTIIGSISGYYGGRIDHIIMRIIDILMAIPMMMLAIVIVAALGASMRNMVLALTLSQVPTFTRVVRGAVLVERDKEYIEAAKAIGSKDSEIIFSHLLPNSASPVIVQIAIRAAASITNAASLSFLGLGIQPPTPEWGEMISSGRPFIRDYSYMTYVPGIAIMLTILSLNLLGDGLRDALDPKLK